jgi:UDP-N-acetylglucosamine 2-epimerase (non-hydrolysing)
LTSVSGEGRGAGRDILVPFGTRPEFVKLAPVVARLRAAGHRVRTVATGQHYDPEMADAFFDELGVEPDERWSLEGDEPERLGQITSHAERELAEHRPELVLVLGDTNTIPSFCLAARRARVPVAHLEAGLRSFNETSIEEVNRKVAAVTARLQLAPTGMAAGFLRAEGIPDERIEVVGNPVIDVLVRSGAAPVPLPERSGVLVTAHRATNVDDRERLANLVDLVVRLAKEVGPVTFPLHPRTSRRLEESGELARLDTDGVRLSGPVPYGEMLHLLSHATVAVTDSGGVQEEASYFGVPTVVLRRSTPRWEGVALGTSRLVGMDADAAVEAAISFSEPAVQARVAAVPCPYGDGHTSERVADLLGSEETWKAMAIDEPDLRSAALEGPEGLAALLTRLSGGVSSVFGGAQ